MTFYPIFKFSRVFSVAVLASAAVAAPQYFLPNGFGQTIYTTGAIAPHAIAVTFTDLAGGKYGFVYLNSVNHFGNGSDFRSS